MDKTWPLGLIPKELQRPELDILKENGYIWQFPHQVVEIFEQKWLNFLVQNMQLR